MESHGILEDHFPGLESHGKQQRSRKVLENDDNVVEFLHLHRLHSEILLKNSK